MSVGYVSQHKEELAGGGTVLDAAQRATGLTPGKARALLGRFHFSGDDAQKPVAGLSGGELRRLSLAVLVNSGANAASRSATGLPARDAGWSPASQR